MAELYRSFNGVREAFIDGDLTLLHVIGSGSISNHYAGLLLVLLLLQSRYVGPTYLHEGKIFQNNFIISSPLLEREEVNRIY